MGEILDSEKENLVPEEKSPSEAAKQTSQVTQENQEEKNQVSQLVMIQPQLSIPWATQFSTHQLVTMALVLKTLLEIHFFFMVFWLNVF